MAALENLWDKYAVTAKQLNDLRDNANRELAALLSDLGYD